jgi:hypothetical protein
MHSASTSFLYLISPSEVASSCTAFVFGKKKAVSFFCASLQISEWKLQRRKITECLDQLLARLLLMNDLNYDCAENVADDRVQQIMNDFAKLTTSARLGAMDASRHRVVILLDDNMYYASMRYEIYQLARKRTYIHSTNYDDGSLVRGIMHGAKNS